MEYLNQLNTQQREAVTYVDGPQLVIAGAGSGKTRVLTYKIVHLLNLGYEPWRILALTFTNKAAREMRERIEQLVGSRVASQLWMGTFHSIFARILRRYADLLGFKSNFTIYDTADSKSLVKTIIRDLDLDDKLYKHSSVLSAISMAKNALVSPERYVQLRDVMEADRNARRPRIHEIYRIYRDRCFSSNAMDFDDLLYYTNLLLRDHPEVCRHYQEYFSYLLVDEYQDTNFAQHVIVSQICKESHRLCVVGDDAQSIYSFRGANISNILNLNKAYPELKIFKLEQNYRSTQNIINAANSLIAKNTTQIPKEVFSTNDVGDKIDLVKSFSDYEEGYVVANRIVQQKMRTHDSYEDFAILYRTNAQSRVLEESLRKRNIPYRIYGGLSFYQRKEVKDAIAYFRLTINSDDDEALKRIINFPSRGIGETTVNKLIRTAIDSNVSIWQVISDLQAYNPGVNAGTARKLDAFRSMIQSFIDFNESGKDAVEVTRKIITDTKLLSMLMTDRTPENISKQENLEELISGVNEFVTTRTEEGIEGCSLSDFLTEISLATDQDSESDENPGERVTLMTVHAAKGLEFNNVFIVGLEEDLFPSAMSSSSIEDIEEERRLLYVAITRAKNFCLLSYAGSRYRNGTTNMCKPSRFIKDINPLYINNMTISGGRTTDSNFSSFASSYHTPQRIGYNASISRQTSSPSNVTTNKTVGGYQIHHYSSLSEGMTIEHERFGKGTIISIDTVNDPRIVVDFDNTGQRTLLLKFAKIKLL